jgi:F0F1-type ATP synthase assembly protein I
VNPNEKDPARDAKPASKEPAGGGDSPFPLPKLVSGKERDNSLDGIALGCQFGAVIVIFVGIGLFLDSKLQSSPAFVVVFLFLGFGGALYSLIIQTGAAGGKSDSQDKRGGGSKETKR